MSRGKQNRESLTSQELEFAALLARGDLDQSKCLRAAFPKKASWTQPAIAVEASRLANKPKVALMVQEIRQGAAEDKKDAHAQHLAMLRRVYEKGMEEVDGKPIGLGAAGKAAENWGKAHGLYETRIRDVTQDNVAEAESYVDGLITSDDPLDRAYGRKKAGEWGFPHLVEKADQLETQQPNDKQDSQRATVQ